MKRVLAIAAVMASFASTAQAGTVVVPGDQPTIQQGIDAAQDGDTVRVKRGEYTESVDVDGRADLNIVFESGAILRSAGDALPFYLDGSTNISLRGVAIDGSIGEGVLLYDCDGVTLSRCSIVGTNGAGIYIENSVNTRVERCSVSSIDDDGIYIVGNDTVVTRCEVESTAGDGIHIRADRVLVDRCVVRDAGEVGISATRAGSDGLRIVRCRVTETADDGIKVNFPGTVIDKCVVTDAGGDSIELRSSAVDCVVRRCKTIRGGDWGVNVMGTGCTIEKNKIVKPTTGIGISGDDHTIVKNKISKPSATGIFLFATAQGNAVERNGVKKAGAYGVVLEGTNNTLTKNKSAKSGTAGLDDRSGGANTLVKNKLK